MANNSRTAEVLLKWQVDTASVNRVRASFAGVENELDDLRAELTGVGTDAQRGISGLRDRFAQGERSIESMQAEVEDLRRELLTLDDVKVTPTIDIQRAVGGGASGTLDEVDRGGRVAGQILSGLGQGEAANAAGLIGDVAGAFTSLNPAMLATVAVGGALTLVVGQLTKAYEEAKTAAKEYLAAQTEINALILAGDSEGLAARRAQLEADINARNQTSESLRGLVARFDELQLGADAILSGQEDLNTTGLNYAEILAAQEQIIKQIGVETNGQITNIGVLRDSLVDFDAETAGLVADLALVKGGIVDLNLEAENTKGGLVNVTKGLNDANLALINIGKTAEFIGGIAGGTPVDTKGAKAAAEAEAAALLSDRTDAYLAAITKTTQAQELLTKAQRDYQDGLAQSALRIAEINAKRDDEIAQAQSDRIAGLAEAEKQAGEEQVRAKEQYEAEKARIGKRFDRANFDAIANRDALAATRAEQARDDELKANQEQYDQQLRAVDKSLKRQQEVIQARYDQQIRTINAAAQAAVRSEQAAAAARLSALQQGVKAAQTALINAQQSEFLIRQNFYNQAVSQAQIWANLMRLYTSYGFSPPSGSGGYVGGGGGAVPRLPTPMATGGTMYRGGVYLTGEQGPELIVPTQPGRVIPNGAAFSMNFNLEGATMQTIKVTSRQEALAAFDRVIAQMGVQ